MPELRHLIPKSTAKAMWAEKDKLEVLTRDPMKLHKEAFIQYLEAKGSAMLENGEPHEAIEAHLTQLTAEWKAEAKAINERRNRGFANQPA